MAGDQEREPTRIDLALDSVNAGYVAELYEQYQRDPSAVDREWRVLFESGAAGFQPAAPSERREPGDGNGTAAQPEPETPAQPAPAPGTAAQSQPAPEP